MQSLVMNYSIPFRKRIAVSITALMCMVLWFFLFVETAFAVHCEILKSGIYQNEQNVIAADWKDGVPYMRYTTEIYQCADITFKNNFWQAVYSTDFEVTATFDDKSTKSRRIQCDKKLLEPGDTYSCSICFETHSPISLLECNLR
jgi:hypothetical protein